MGLLDEVAGTPSQPNAAPAASAPAAAQGSLLDQVAQENKPTTPTTTTGTNAPTTPSYLSQVEDHIANTAHAIWHGLSGTEASPLALAQGAAPTETAETEAEKGSTQGTEFKQAGFTNENIGYTVGSTIKGAADFFGGLAKDVFTKKPIDTKLDYDKMSPDDPRLAKSLIGKYIAAPSLAERAKVEQEMKEYYNAPDTASAVSHGLSALIHKGAEWVPMVGPFAASIIEEAQKGNVGGAIAQIAALEGFDKATESPAAKVKNAIGLRLLSPEDRASLQAEAAKQSAAAAEAAKQLAAVAATKKNVVKTAPVAPVAPPVGVPRNPEIGPQERTVAGPQTTLRPTTQTTAGVTAPITALQQENVSPLARVGAKLASPGSDAEFQKTQTQPAAQRQLISTIGQAAEDKIAKHEAIMDGKPTPNPIAGSQTPSKFQTFDDAAKATETSATKTYQKADAVSDRDVAAWQTATRDALNEHKAAIDRYNQMVDEYNANRNTADDKEMPRATYDPNAVSIPEKPQSYSELKAELDRAKAEGASSDAAVREEAYKTGIPKAEKAIDQWFKQHSDDISPAEYASAKSLYADSQRFQEVANGLRSATNKGTLTGNTLRGLESTIDNKMIRRGQAPGAFRRLLGEDAYDNWKNVAKLFDPVKGALQGQKSWGTYATEYIVASVLGIKGIAAKAATEMLMNRVMFHPEWGQWFSKFTNTLKNLATREHGELGAPGTVGEPFDQNDRQHFFDLMNEAQGKTAGEVKAQATPTPSLLDQVHEEQNPNYVYRARGVGEQGVPLTNEHAQATSDLAQAQKYAEAGQRSPEQGEVVRVDLNKLNHEDYNIKQHPDGMQWAQFTRPLGEHEVEQVPPATPTSEASPDSEGRWPKNTDDSVLESHYAAKYPEVPEGTKVDGRTVIDSVDNMSSIAASLPNYLILDGIRKVDFRQFDMKPDITPRTKALAEQIKKSDSLMPLIVGVDADGPFIMEGSHRYDALKILNAKEIPAVVALDLDALHQKETPPGAKPATAVTDEYKQSLGANEIATTRPSAVGADNTNNPDRTSGIKTLAEATPKMRETIAQSIANYKDSGLKLTPDELEDPASYQASIIKKAVSHYKNNLVALYNAIPESIRGISKQWYESAHDLSKKFSEQYGVSHPQAAAVIAALSPNNPWDNNVGMAQRLMKTWEEDTGRIWDEKMDEKLSSIRNAKSTKPEFRAYLDSIRGKSYNDLQGETEAETAAMKGLWLRMVDQSYGSPEIPVYAPDGTIRGSQKIAWGPYDAVAKAVKILDDGDIETINHLMGNGHKIRNFYNNIISPWSDRGHVTIDTHAVGAAHWKPFSQKDTEVAHNFGGSTPGIPGAGKHAGTGLQGTYPIYDEAYKQAAKEVGVSPRELQSITWEGIRSLFSGAKKTPELRKAVSEIWAKVGEGKMTPEAARQAIIERAGGFKRPVWTTDSQWTDAGGKKESETIAPTRELKDKSTEFNPENFANTDQLAAHKANGGSTFDTAGNDLNGKDKYSVGAYPNRTMSVNGDLTEDDIQYFKDKNADALGKPNHAVGTWKDTDTGKHVLDVTKLYDNRDEAIAAGKAANQKAVYNLGSGELIDTGGTGEGSIIDAMKQKYGTTNNVLKAGFILPEGDMIPLVGEHDHMLGGKTIENTREQFIRDSGAIRTRYRMSRAGEEQVFSLPSEITEDQARQIRYAASELKNGRIVLETVDGTHHQLIDFPTASKVQQAVEGLVKVNPSVAKGLNQTISLGEGANSIKADVNSAELNPELKGQPRPTIVRNVSGHIPKAQIENLAKWMDANVSPKDMLISAAHEIAHEFTQHYHGLPTADTGVTLGHSALEKAVAGGYFDTGRGWKDRLKVARATGGDAMSKFLDDYTSHTMAGRAIEEMLGEPPSVVKEHASGDTSAAKHVLKASGMHPYIMDNYLTAATERAKEILRDNWDTVHHMTAQAVQHFGKGKIDADTLQKYRQGGTYK